MTWASRLRLLFGVVLVLVLAALATYKLNENRGRATSTSAQIVGQEIAVGAPYAGIVLDRPVKVGDQVHKGDTLFTIDSATLSQARAQGAGQVPQATVVDKAGHLVVQAAEDGTVTQLQAQPGAFVQAGGQLGTVQRAGSLTVEAQYTLTPKEYARVSRQEPVTIVLPDQRTVVGSVDQMRVTTVNGKAQAVVDVTSPGLTSGAGDGMVTAGTPVVAQLQLRNDGVVTTVADKVRTYVQGLIG